MAELTPADRLALALCPDRSSGAPCETPCDSCRRDSAAVARELAEQVVPDGPRPSADYDYHLMSWSRSLDQYAQRQQTRAKILAIAAELEGVNG
jgi:hypothetical protein